MTLIIKKGVRLRQAYVGTDDPDAAAYIAAVEAADGQGLETAVQVAIHSFVKDCKADGIWSAIKASCILAGARTLSGALVPLVGPAPTNFNFVSGDYNRKTGLMGDGSTKRLNSNRLNTGDPVNNMHLSVFIKQAPSGIVFPIAIADRTGGEAGSSQLNPRLGETAWAVRNRSSSADTPSNTAYSALGFAGVSRASSSAYDWRVDSKSGYITRASQLPAPINYGIFGTASNASSNARLSFYSIGEALDLALLDARVTTLMSAFAAAIP